MRTAEVETGDATGRRPRVAVETQADHQVGPDGVGGSGALGVTRAAISRPGQERLHTDRGHPAFEPAGQIPQNVGFADRTFGTLCDQPVIRTAAAGIDDDSLARQPGSGQPNMLFLADSVQGTAGDARPEKVQRPQRFRTADPVGGQTVFALIGHQRVMSLQTEIAVHQSGVEAEILKPGLQGRDVVAVHRGAELMRERPGTESVGRFFEGAIRRLPD